MKRPVKAVQYGKRMTIMVLIGLKGAALLQDKRKFQDVYSFPRCIIVIITVRQPAKLIAILHFIVYVLSE